MGKTYTVLVDDNLLTYSSQSNDQDGEGDEEGWTTGKGHSELFINSSTRDASSDGLSFLYSFYGKSMAWTGVLWETGNVQFSVSVDGGSASTCTSSSGDEDSNVYAQLCQTSFDNGQHTVNVTVQQNEDDSVSLDYIVFTVESDDDVPRGVSPGMYILTDDSDSTIQYDGSWTTQGAIAYTSSGISRFPYGNGTHVSRTVGDKFTYAFTGKSVSLYGVQLLTDGSLTATVDIDGTSYQNVSISNQSGNGGMSNKMLASASGLSSTTHEMVVTVTDISGNQSLIVDYILYEPIYDKAGSTGSKGWVAGVVTGMLAVLALMAALVWWFWKRKHRHRGNFDIDGGTPEKYLSVPTSEPTNPESALKSLSYTGPSLLARANTQRDAARGISSLDGDSRQLFTTRDDDHIPYPARSRTSAETFASTASLMRGRMAETSIPSTSRLFNPSSPSIASIAPPVPHKGRSLSTTPDFQLSPPPDPAVAASQSAMLEKNKLEAHASAPPPSAFRTERRYDNRRSSPTSSDSSHASDAAGGSRIAELEALLSQNRKMEAITARRSSSDSFVDHGRSGSSRRSTSDSVSAPLPSSRASAEQMEDQFEELRRRNEILAREVARLSELPPPAYEAS